VLRREEIYERVWGYAMAHGDRSVDVFVRKLAGRGNFSHEVHNLAVLAD
jgi:DNA-binding response OmpR family regulator